MSKEEFLKEYKVLCEKYEIFISACGCCSSPWIEDADTPEELKEHIEHLSSHL